MRGMRTILRLGCLAGLEPDVLPRVTQLAKPHAPDVDVQVVSASSPRLVELLRARELDFAVMRRQGDAVDLDFKTVASHPFVVLLPSDHRLARQRSIAFRDLQTQPYIAVSRKSAPALRDAVDSWCQQQSLILTPSHTVNDFGASLSLILTTHGFALCRTMAGISSRPPSPFAPWSAVRLHYRSSLRGVQRARRRLVRSSRL